MGPDTVSRWPKPRLAEVLRGTVDGFALYPANLRCAVIYSKCLFIPAGLGQA